MNKLKFLGACLLLIAAVSTPALANDKIDPALPDYAVASGVDGNINSVGSDTLANLMTLWLLGAAPRGDRATGPSDCVSL